MEFSGWYTVGAGTYHTEFVHNWYTCSACSRARLQFVHYCTSHGELMRAWQAWAQTGGASERAECLGSDVSVRHYGCDAGLCTGVVAA